LRQLFFVNDRGYFTLETIKFALLATTEHTEITKYGEHNLRARRAAGAAARSHPER
jgi:hypothetical protein